MQVQQIIDALANAGIEVINHHPADYVSHASLQISATVSVDYCNTFDYMGVSKWFEDEECSVSSDALDLIDTNLSKLIEQAKIFLASTGDSDTLIAEMTA